MGARRLQLEGEALSYLEVDQVIHKAKGQKVPIDGERKAVLVRVDIGNFRFEGLIPRSQWSKVKAMPGRALVTQRTLIGATLHMPQLEGQLPPVGLIIPVKLFKGRSGLFRTGKAMDSHLVGLANTQKWLKADAKRYRAIKADIVG